MGDWSLLAGPRRCHSGSRGFARSFGLDAPRRQGDALRIHDDADRHRRDLRRGRRRCRSTLSRSTFVIRDGMRFCRSSAGVDRQQLMPLMRGRVRDAPGHRGIQSPLHDPDARSPPTDRISFDGKTGVPKAADRARHMAPRSPAASAHPVSASPVLCESRVF